LNAICELYREQSRTASERRADSIEFVRFALRTSKLAGIGAKDDEGSQAGDDDAQNDEEQKGASSSTGFARRWDWRLHGYSDAGRWLPVIWGLISLSHCFGISIGLDSVCGEKLPHCRCYLFDVRL
jgi:hypothetical protein